MSLPDAKDYALSRATVLTEGYKGLLAVHGGAIAATLAFSSQAAVRSQALLQAVFVSVLIFGVGLALALLIPYFRFMNSKVAETRDRDAPAQAPSKSKTLSWFAYTICQYLSVGAFLAGAVVIACTGYTESASMHQAATVCK